MFVLLASLLTPASAAPLDPRATVVAAAAAAYEDAEARFTAGMAPLDEVYVWSKRWLEAGQSMDPAAAKAHAARMARLSAAVSTRVAAGAAPASEAKATAFYVAEAAVLAK